MFGAAPGLGWRSWSDVVNTSMCSKSTLTHSPGNLLLLDAVSLHPISICRDSSTSSGNFGGSKNTPVSGSLLPNRSSELEHVKLFYAEGAKL